MSERILLFLDNLMNVCNPAQLFCTSLQRASSRVYYLPGDRGDYSLPGKSSQGLPGLPEYLIQCHRYLLFTFMAHLITLFILCFMQMALFQHISRTFALRYYEKLQQQTISFIFWIILATDDLNFQLRCVSQVRWQSVQQ